MPTGYSGGNTYTANQSTGGVVLSFAQNRTEGGAGWTGFLLIALLAALAAWIFWRVF